MPHLLVVDDEDDIRSLLTGFFRRHGHEVSVASDGESLFTALKAQPIDLVILDIMLPGEDGFSLCREIRATSGIPIIMLTAIADHVDRVVGLEMGADDYLIKPFDARELLARVKAVLRRSAQTNCTVQQTETRPILSFEDWRLDIARSELRSADNTLTVLSRSEFDLLLAFAEHPQQILTRDQLLDLSRGSSHEAYDRSIDVQVARLRRKLDTGTVTPSIIRTVRGGGYMFTAQVRRG
ncbi:response regulator [Burkholderia cepacia]|uniref:response regulator n=1 Tax=Burkholderia cepacia TaxID=292 RepID=UPI00075236F9|nr:response regulator transcription factor [Burkholderia cepacia]KVU60305.1 two-component system response regulator [Burkholderia cepacia]